MRLSRFQKSLTTKFWQQQQQNINFQIDLPCSFGSYDSIGHSIRFRLVIQNMK